MRLHTDSQLIDHTLERSSFSEDHATHALTDEQVVERVLSGDTASFELIMRRYNQRLFRIARSILNDDHEAEDVLQEAYWRAFQKLSQFEGRAQFSTWLTRIAVHEASAKRRKTRRLRLMDHTNMNALEEAEVAPDSKGELSMHELRTILASAVEVLPVELRTVFMLRLVEGLDTQETAECLELTEANVKVRLHRARSMLQTWIDGQIGVEARRMYEFNGKRCDCIVRCVMERISQQ
jgi:RNA polymerase sigma-70 factor (ECF subfamily)